MLYNNRGKTFAYTGLLKMTVVKENKSFYDKRLLSSGSRKQLSFPIKCVYTIDYHTNAMDNLNLKG